MDSTIIVLKEGTKLYRSYTNESKKYGNWFSTEVSDTYGYGSNTAHEPTIVTTRLSIDNDHTREITKKFNEMMKNIDLKKVKEIQEKSELLKVNKRKNTTRKRANSSNT